MGGATVQFFDGATGAAKGVWSGDRKLNLALGMAWGPDGNLYVANQGASEIRRYDGRTGAPLGAFVTPGSGGLLMPAFLLFRPTATLTLTALDPRDRVVVSGARPGARVLVARGTAGGHGKVAPCPELTLDVGSPVVAASVISDESGGAVVAVAGFADGQAVVAVDGARCLATAAVPYSAARR